MTQTPAARRPSTRRGALDYRVLAEFRHQLRLFMVFSEEQSRAAGLEPQQHQLLLALTGIREGQRPTIRALAERLQLKHHTVVGLVDRLVRRNLVVRRKSDADAREILVEMTPNGRRVLRSLSEAHQIELRTAGPALVRALEAIVASPKPKGAGRRRR